MQTILHVLTDTLLAALQGFVWSDRSAHVINKHNSSDLCSPLVLSKPSKTKQQNVEFFVKLFLLFFLVQRSYYNQSDGCKLTLI